MKILSIGSFNGTSNTCVHRNWILQELADVHMVNMYEKPKTLWFRIAYKLYNLGLPIKLPDISNSNQQIKKLISKNDYDIVWIDKGWLVSKKTMQLIKDKNPLTKIASYSPDNMALRHNQSQQYLETIPLYDVHFTTKSYNIDQLKRLGAKKVIFVNKTYQEDFHYPRNLSDIDKQKYTFDIGFIGVWEKERCDSIKYLVDNGLNVSVYGDKEWNGLKNYASNLKVYPSLKNDEYPKALSAFKISLCFLRKINYDQQTSRTMEIPACGSFMLAERTNEHMGLFVEGKEAEFFSDDQELLEKCKYYLLNENERIKIAENGLKRCRESGYSNKKTISTLLKKVLE